MVKQIKTEMQSNGNIVISINDDPKLTIERTTRKINAMEVYSLLDYHNGDSYTLIQSNPYDKDKNVLVLFSDLLQQITNKLNEVSATSQTDTVTINQEEMM